MVGIIERVGHWKSTGAGLAVGAVVYVVLTSFECKLPANWLMWATSILPMILGALAKG